MPVIYAIDAARRIVRTRCEGAATLAEVLGHLRTLAEDPACPDRLDVLLDLSGQETLPEAPQLRRVSEEIARVRDRVRFGACAIVAPSSALFGMLRMFEVFVEGQFRVTRVFRGVAEAEEWLRAQVESALPG